MWLQKVHNFLKHFNRKKYSKNIPTRLLRSNYWVFDTQWSEHYQISISRKNWKIIKMRIMEKHKFPENP